MKPTSDKAFITHFTEAGKVQRFAARQGPELRSMTYEDRLEGLSLMSLEDRRPRGDMITAYKILR